MSDEKSNFRPEQPGPDHAPKYPAGTSDSQPELEDLGPVATSGIMAQPHARFPAAGGRARWLTVVLLVVFGVLILLGAALIVVLRT